jgi:putative DNA primase/helicase
MGGAVVTDPYAEYGAARIYTPGLERFDKVAIRDALRGREHEVVEYFRGAHNPDLSSKKELRWGDKWNTALKLEISGAKAGLWYDFASERGGDIFGLVQYEAGCDFPEALELISSILGISPGGPVSPRPARPVVEEKDDAPERISRALELWDEAKPLTGTIAERYLLSRHVAPNEEALAVLRFHPRCPWGEGQRVPAMVALIQCVITDEPIGIHRTGLNTDGTKLGRRTLGHKAGGAIKLYPDSLITDDLAIGEGIETVLSFKPLGCDAPAWSLIDAGELRNFPVLPHVNRLIIAVDNDRSQTGLKAAQECSDRWRDAGKRVRLVFSDETGDDLNDFLRKDKTARS